MPAIRLSFGVPQHGWLLVQLSSGDAQRRFDASGVPADSLQMLAVAMLNIIEGRPEDHTVTWFLEPEHEIWTFSLAGESCQLAVVRAPEHGSESVLFARGSIDEVCVPIWRALRRLEAEPAWSDESAERVWSHSFPGKEVAQLGDRIRARLSAASKAQPGG